MHTSQQHMHMISEKQKKGDKNMRLAKKLGAVVAMAAVCLTTVAPTTASAATCPPHYYTKTVDTNVITEGAYREHEYEKGFQEINGQMVPIFDTCRVDKLIYYHTKACTFCGDISSVYTTEEKYKHVSCGRGIVDTDD